jgi:glucosamine kinase
VERCGGWGMYVGDEGSGYAIGRAALAAALRAVDGREEETRLLPLFLELLGVEGPREIPPWVGRVSKGEVAALAAHVLRVAEEGDALARLVVSAEARALAHHAGALRQRLAPWPGETQVVFHGGVLQSTFYASLVSGGLREEGDFRVVPPVADAVAGAVRFARALAAS